MALSAAALPSSLLLNTLVNRSIILGAGAAASAGSGAGSGAGAGAGAGSGVGAGAGAAASSATGSSFSGLLPKPTALKALSIKDGSAAASEDGLASSVVSSDTSSFPAVVSESTGALTSLFSSAGFAPIPKKLNTPPSPPFCGRCCCRKPPAYCFVILDILVIRIVILFYYYNIAFFYCYMVYGL